MLSVCEFYGCKRTHTSLRLEHFLFTGTFSLLSPSFSRSKRVRPLFVRPVTETLSALPLLLRRSPCKQLSALLDVPLWLAASRNFVCCLPPGSPVTLLRVLRESCTPQFRSNGSSLLVRSWSFPPSFFFFFPQVFKCLPLKCPQDSLYREASPSSEPCLV